VSPDVSAVHRTRGHVLLITTLSALRGRGEPGQHRTCTIAGVHTSSLTVPDFIVRRTPSSCLRTAVTGFRGTHCAAVTCVSAIAAKKKMMIRPARRLPVPVARLI
jgi:hypothetical protein